MASIKNYKLLLPLFLVGTLISLTACPHGGYVTASTPRSVTVEACLSGTPGAAQEAQKHCSKYNRDAEYISVVDGCEYHYRCIDR